MSDDLVDRLYDRLRGLQFNHPKMEYFRITRREVDALVARADEIDRLRAENERLSEHLRVIRDALEPR